MKRIAVASAVIAAVSTWPRAAEAYRPFDSTDAAVAERGDLELEIGPVGYLRANHRSYVAPIQVLNLGFVEGWELVLQGAPVIPGSRSRVSLAETQLTVKAVLRPGCLQGKTGLSIATEFGVLLPTVNDEAGAGAIADVIVSQRFAWGTFHLNVQGARLRSGNPDGFVGLISEGPITWRVRPVTELFVEREFSTSSTFSALAGIIGRVSENYDLDAGARLASVGGREVFEVRAGFSWALGLW